MSRVLAWAAVCRARLPVCQRRHPQAVGPRLQDNFLCCNTRPGCSCPQRPTATTPRCNSGAVRPPNGVCALHEALHMRPPCLTPAHASTAQCTGCDDQMRWMQGLLQLPKNVPILVLLQCKSCMYGEYLEVGLEELCPDCHTLNSRLCTHALCSTCASILRRPFLPGSTCRLSYAECPLMVHSHPTCTTNSPMKTFRWFITHVIRPALPELWRFTLTSLHSSS